MGAANNLDALCSKRRPTRKRRLGPSDQRHSEAGAEPDALMRALPAPPVLNTLRVARFALVATRRDARVTASSKSDL